MPKRIPIKAAREIGKQNGCSQVILVCWDGERTHVVTWGRSVEDCDQAAQGGNFVKRALGWPANMTNAEPSRVRKLKAEIASLKRKLEKYSNLDDKHAPLSYVTRERLVQLPKNIVKELGVEDGGGVTFFLGENEGHVVIISDETFSKMLPDKD